MSNISFTTASSSKPGVTAPFDEVMRRVTVLSQKTPEEIMRLASGDDPEGLLDLNVNIEARGESLLRPWSQIKRASARRLSDKQYDAFLRGDEIPESESETQDVGSQVMQMQHTASWPLAVLGMLLNIAPLLGFGFIFFSHDQVLVDSDMKWPLLGIIIGLLASEVAFYFAGQRRESERQARRHTIAHGSPDRAP